MFSAGFHSSLGGTQQKTYRADTEDSIEMMQAEPNRPQKANC